MKQILRVHFVVFLAFSIAFAGCSKDKDEVANEEELITTAVLEFRDNGSSDRFSVIFSDPDGEGGEEPVSFDEIRLRPNTTYSVTTTLLNESADPDTDITAEVAEEADDHQFYYIPEGVNISVNVTDQDNAGLPLGILSQWTTGEASAGTMRFVLKHKPGNKASNDDVTKGETDIDLNFVATVQE